MKFLLINFVLSWLKGPLKVQVGKVRHWFHHDNVAQNNGRWCWWSGSNIILTHSYNGSRGMKACNSFFNNPNSIGLPTNRLLRLLRLTKTKTVRKSCVFCDYMQFELNYRVFGMHIPLAFFISKKIFSRKPHKLNWKKLNPMKFSFSPQKLFKMMNNTMRKAIRSLHHVEYMWISRRKY